MRDELLSPDGFAQEVTLNRRKAIRLKCLECSNEEYKEVINCPCTTCSLYPFRSGRGKQDPKERDLAIKIECMSCMAGQTFEISNCGMNCPLREFRGYTRPPKMIITYKKVSSAGIRRHDLPSAETEHQERENASSERLYTDKSKE
jgi:hypothetical protein